MVTISRTYLREYKKNPISFSQYTEWLVKNQWAIAKVNPKKTSNQIPVPLANTLTLIIGLLDTPRQNHPLVSFSNSFLTKTM